MKAEILFEGNKYRIIEDVNAFENVIQRLNNVITKFAGEKDKPKYFLHKNLNAGVREIELNDIVKYGWEIITKKHKFRLDVQFKINSSFDTYNIKIIFQQKNIMEVKTKLYFQIPSNLLVDVQWDKNITLSTEYKQFVMLITELIESSIIGMYFNALEMKYIGEILDLYLFFKVNRKINFFDKGYLKKSSLKLYAEALKNNKEIFELHYVEKKEIKCFLKNVEKNLTSLPAV